MYDDFYVDLDQLYTTIEAIAARRGDRIVQIFEDEEEYKAFLGTVDGSL